MFSVEQEHYKTYLSASRCLVRNHKHVPNEKMLHFDGSGEDAAVSTQKK